MIQTLLPTSATPNAAWSLAASNYAANLAALATVQPDAPSALSNASPEVDWIFARDGSLTAMLPGEKWWGGCSLPRRAGQFMFKVMEIRGVVGCFLAPVHAAHIRIALDLLEPHQAILSLVPDQEAFRIILHCEDFSADIRGHRLWVAAGEDWQNQLRGILTENPGLPTPAEFIRAISADNAQADQLIAPSQKIFNEETARRSAEVQSLSVPDSPRDASDGRAPATRQLQASAPSLCVIAPSQFRLWNDAPTVLAGIVSGSDSLTATLFDSDNPASASPLGLAMALRECDALVTANLGRADLPKVVPAAMPLVTWVTLPRIPAHDPANLRDALILADPAWQSRAADAGWPKERISIGGWPQIVLGECKESAVAALIADTCTLLPPKQVSEFSSHLLLWDLIVSELSREPGLAGTDLDGYLKSRMARFQVDEQSLNRGFFIERLVVPAYQQGLALALLEQGIRVQLWGNGWKSIEAFAPRAAGPVKSKAQFDGIVAGAGALVHAWPIAHIHPIDAAGRPVIRPTFSRQPPPFHTLPSISPETILGLLR